MYGLLENKYYHLSVFWAILVNVCLRTLAVLQIKQNDNWLCADILDFTVATFDIEILFEKKTTLSSFAKR